jgi:hypothetical protein
VFVVSWADVLQGRIRGRQILAGPLAASGRLVEAQTNIAGDTVYLAEVVPIAGSPGTSGRLSAVSISTGQRTELGTRPSSGDYHLGSRARPTSRGTLVFLQCTLLPPSDRSCDLLEAEGPRLRVVSSGWVALRDVSDDGRFALVERDARPAPNHFVVVELATGRELWHTTQPVLDAQFVR